MKVWRVRGVLRRLKWWQQVGLISAVLAITAGFGLTIGKSVYAALFGGSASSSDTINLDKGLFAHWKFDGNAKDATPYTNNGTLSGPTNAADRKGQASKAYSFDGDDDFIGLGSTFGSTLTEGTIAVWVNSTLSVQMAMFNRSNSNGSGEAVFQLTSAGKLTWAVRATSGNFNVLCQTVEVITADTWTHVAVTVNSSGNKVFINGEQATCNYANGSASSTEFLDDPQSVTTTRVGRRDVPGTSSDNWFEGLMDDMRIYNRAISDAEVAALAVVYDAGVSLGDDQKGLLGHWKMNGNAKDATPYGNNGTVNGATLTTDRRAKANSAYGFDGSDDEIQLNGGSVSTNATIAGWFNYGTGADTNKVLYRDNTSGGVDGWILWVNGDEEFFIRIAGTQYDTNLSALGYRDTWAHFAVTKSGSNIAFYINGNEVFTGAGAASTAPAMPWHLMRNGTNNGTNDYTVGMVDDFRIYDTALAEDELADIYNSYDETVTVSDLQKGLVGYWDMNGDARDSTPYSNNGTVTSATLTGDRKGAANSAYSFNGSNAYIGLSTIDIP